MSCPLLPEPVLILTKTGREGGGGVGGRGGVGGERVRGGGRGVGEGGDNLSFLLSHRIHWSKI